MAKRPAIVQDDDGSISIDLETPASRKFGGTDENPTDADTGEEIFADLTPRLRNMQIDDDLSDDDEEVTEEDDEDQEEGTDEDQDEPVVSDDDEGEEEVEEGASRSRKPSKFEKRLAREQRLRRESDAERAELRARLDRLENKQKSSADEATFAAEKSRLTGEIENTRVQLEKAIEEGDSKAQAKLVETLSDQKAELSQKTREFEAAKKSTTNDTQSQQQASTLTVTKVKQWIRKHPRFNRDPEFAALVRATDRSIGAEGFDPESDEFYTELDRRLKKRYPEEYKRAPKRNSPPSVNARSETATTARKTERFQVRNGRVTLSARDQANMRKFQLDPTNPSDVRDYVVNNRK